MHFSIIFLWFILQLLCMSIDPKSDDLKKNSILRLFLVNLIFVPFSVSAITFHEFFSENPVFSKKEYLSGQNEKLFF